MHIYESLVKPHSFCTLEVTFSHKDIANVLPKRMIIWSLGVQMFKCNIKKVLIDLGSSTDILNWDSFEQLQLNPEYI